MRRAEARRSASVMINSSIRWSLAGYDVDWRMKTSEPRTFSWISTKISMSADRRTTVFVNANPSSSAIAVASAGLELPATSLMEPFLADIEISPRALLETIFSISGTRGTGNVARACRYQGEYVAGNPPTVFSLAKMGANCSGVANGRYSQARRRDCSRRLSQRAWLQRPQARPPMGQGLVEACRRPV